MIEEEQHLVYREAGGSSASASGELGPAPEAAATLRLDVDPTLLFRFSALTYNAHRIHYDRDVRDRRGGLSRPRRPRPAAGARDGRGRPAPGGEPDGPVRFDYRLVAPMYDGEGLVATADRGDDGSVVTRVRTGAGRATAEGVLTPVGAPVADPPGSRTLRLMLEHLRLTVPPPLVDEVRDLLDRSRLHHQRRPPSGRLPGPGGRPARVRRRPRGGERGPRRPAPDGALARRRGAGDDPRQHALRRGRADRRAARPVTRRTP